jgi:hypothetical protein
MENVYEQFFFLKYHGGWSFAEAYNLPVGLRMWFVKRLMKQLKDEKEAMDNAKTDNSSSNGFQQLSRHNQPKKPKSIR